MAGCCDFPRVACPQVLLLCTFSNVGACVHIFALGKLAFFMQQCIPPCFGSCVRPARFQPSHLVSMRDSTAPGRHARLGVDVYAAGGQGVA